MIAEPDTSTPAIWRPFPVDALPRPIRRFVKRVSEAMGCDASFVALPALVACAAMIGNSRQVRLKRGWIELPILWAAIVGESGTLKTPAIRAVMRAIRRLQKELLAEHEQQLQLHEDDLHRYEADLKDWKKKRLGDPPPKPETPTPTRLIASDVTVEALAPILLANPRGILLCPEELNGWIGSFTRYKQSSDAPHWLSMHSGEPIIVDRKTGNPPTLYVPRASVNIVGGIQPGILRRALSMEYRDAGLAARLLPVMPPRKPKRWTDADIPDEVEADFAGIIMNLRALAMADGDEPMTVSLHPDAKAAFTSFYDEHAEEQAELSGDLAAAWSKLEAYAARLALLIHCVRQAGGEPVGDAIDGESMASAIVLTRWFGDEAKRVYSLFDRDDDDGGKASLTDWIAGRGGDVSLREMWRAKRRQFDAMSDLRSELDAIAAEGKGRWYYSQNPRGGQPSERFTLATGGDVSDTPRGDAASEGTVTVTSGNAVAQPIHVNGKLCEVVE